MIDQQDAILLKKRNDINKKGNNYYQRRKKKSLCVRCGKKIDRIGCYCTNCNEKRKEYNRKTRDFCRENHICTECKKEKVYGEDKICFECRAKRNKYRRKMTEKQKRNFREQQNKLYKQRAEQGICTRCGKRKASFDRKKCAICLEKDAEIHRKRYFDKQNIREYRKKKHLCYYCGKPIDRNDGQICLSCWESCQKNGMKSSSKNEYWKRENKIISKKF